MSLSLDENKQWLDPVRQVISPNCDLRPSACTISLIVIHGISLPPGQFGNDYIDQLFTNKLDPQQHAYFSQIQNLKVSAHVLVDRAGQITQYVPFDARAWHAGESCFEGVRACNDYSIGIELEGCDDLAYEQVQYRQLASIVKVLMQAWPAITRKRIVGHSDIAPGRKTDPGTAFDWECFYNLID